MTTDPLDELIASGTRRKGRGCRYPGCTEPTRAAIHIALRRFAAGSHSAGSFDGSVTRQVSVCERHAVEMWGTIYGAIEPTL